LRGKCRRQAEPIAHQAGNKSFAVNENVNSKSIRARARERESGGKYNAARVTYDAIGETSKVTVSQTDSSKNHFVCGAKFLGGVLTHAHHSIRGCNVRVKKWEDVWSGLQSI
jgi:hypothetical protein